MELYRKYRPAKWSEIVGNQQVIGMLKGFVEAKNVPHFMLFQGPSGCGKTTLARILARSIGCDRVDFTERNCADFRGIDMVRQVRQVAGLAPIAGPCRVYLIDEAHRLTGEAQDAALKLLEEPPDHLYFFFATTDPAKLKRTVRNRATDVVVQLLKIPELIGLIGRVCEAEKIELSERIENILAEMAEGSPRRALVLLDAIKDMVDKDRLEALQNADVERQAIELCRALFNQKMTWPAIADILKNLDEDPESVRWVVLGYATTILLKSGKGRAADVIEAFRDPFHDTKKAGLVAACFELFR